MGTALVKETLHRSSKKLEEGIMNQNEQSLWQQLTLEQKRRVLNILVQMVLKNLNQERGGESQ